MVVVDIACVCGHVHDSSLIRPAMTEQPDRSIVVSWECDPVGVVVRPGLVYGIDRLMVAAHRIFRWLELGRRGVKQLVEAKAPR
jgi:hypothetical protein